MKRVYILIVVIVAAGLYGCGGGSADGVISVASNTPASHQQMHAPVRTAFTVEELGGASAFRAKPHHTIYKEVHHPDSSLAALAVRKVPYTFERSVVKNICIDDRESAGHLVQVLSESRGLIAELRSDRPRECMPVEFEAGDYELHFSHSGSGEPAEPLHVFTHARFQETTADSRFGQWLATQNEMPSTLRSATDSSSPTTCSKIETITLAPRATTTLLDTTLTASTAAFYELWSSAVRGLISYPSGATHAEKTPSSRNYIDVYDCPDGVRFGIPDEKLYLVSQCGYFFFLAQTLDDATPFSLTWDADLRRLDIINPETNRVVKTVPRGNGRIVVNEPKSMNALADVSAGSAPVGVNVSFTPSRPSSIKQLGVCSNYPDVSGGLQPGPLRKKDTSGKGTVVSYPELGAHTPMEFTLTPLTAKAPTTFFDFEERYNFDDSAFKKIAQDYAVWVGPILLARPIGEKLVKAAMQNFSRIALTSGHGVPFGNSVDVQDGNGFVSSHQGEIVVSVNRCESCDITGLDLSGRTFSVLDLANSQVDGVNFKGVQAGGIIFRGAKLINVNLSQANIGAADFSNATVQNVDFSDAVLAQSNINQVTQFDGAIVSHSTFARNDFTSGNWQGAKVDTSTFTDVLLSGINLEGATLTNVNVLLSEAQQKTQPFTVMKNVNLRNSTLNKLRLNTADLSNSDISGANIKELQFAGANLENVNFSGSALSASDFSHSILLGADFSNVQFAGNSLDNVAAYSSGTITTSFKNCVVQSGSFTNSHFMETSFENCDFQGGSFAGSLFINSSFSNARVISDSTGQVISFSSVLLAGADLGGADFSGADLSNAITTANSGKVDIVILTKPGESIEREYNYGSTVRPAVTGPGTTCPNLSLGPCQSDAQWQPSDPPKFKGKEDLNSW